MQPNGYTISDWLSVICLLLLPYQARVSWRQLVEGSMLTLNQSSIGVHGLYLGWRAWESTLDRTEFWGGSFWGKAVQGCTPHSQLESVGHRVFLPCPCYPQALRSCVGAAPGRTHRISTFGTSSEFGVEAAIHEAKNLILDQG